MKTDRASRVWGFLGPVLHLWHFTALRRNEPVWDQLVLWGSLLGNLICLSGLVAGIWRFSASGRYRKKGQAKHSPYSGWLWWHHYTGLIFGLVSFTWIFSGGLAYSYYQGPSIDPTPQQRAVVTGGPLKVDEITLDDIRAGLAAISESFHPREVDLLQFRGELYLFAADGPGERPLIGLTERDAAYKPPKFLMVWAKHPERGTFSHFDHSAAMEIARDAMPGVEIADATWLHNYDNYYRGRQGGQPLPVLRVKYADPAGTWLYIDPNRGSIALRQQQHNRNRRWLYNGLHKFDFPFLYSRPLWDIAIIIMSIGGLALTITTLLPAYRRLRRHAGRATGMMMVLVTVSAPALAHHGVSVLFDHEQRITLKGTVKEFAWTNPHVQLTLRVAEGPFKDQDYAVEMNSPAGMTAWGWTRDSIQPGDQITIRVHPSKVGRPAGDCPYCTVEIHGKPTLRPGSVTMKAAATEH
jgi:hypothetical protein